MTIMLIYAYTALECFDIWQFFSIVKIVGVLFETHCNGTNPSWEQVNLVLAWKPLFLNYMFWYFQNISRHYTWWNALLGYITQRSIHYFLQILIPEVQCFSYVQKEKNIIQISISIEGSLDILS